MRKRIIQSIYILVFMIIITVPMIKANKEDDQIAEGENRYLNGFPTAQIGTEEFKEQLEAWLDDNLGFRQTFLDIRSNVLYKGLNVVLGKNVERGKDGWLFYIPDAEIGRCESLLSIDELREIAEVQQRMHEHYQKLGKTYVLLLIPTKASIYPEYLYGEYTICETLANQVYEYLSQHTDVIVVNSKEKLVENKSEGRLYWETDTHLTSFGSYYIYESLIEELNSRKIIETEIVLAEKTTQVTNGDLMDMIGCLDMEEESDAIEVEFSSTRILNGEYFDRLQEEVDSDNNCNTKALYVYENLKSNDERKVAIYGTSHLFPIRKIPQLIVEHFGGLTYVYQNRNNPIYDIDIFSEADIVINAVGERSIKAALDFWPDAGKMDLPNLKTKSDADLDNIVCIDFVNGSSVHNDSETLKEVVGESKNEKRLLVSGWAADIENKETFGEIYMKIGDCIFKGIYGNEREDVADFYDLGDAKDVGFKFEILTDYLDEINSIEIYMVSKDGTYMCEPVVYEMEGLK